MKSPYQHRQIRCSMTLLGALLLTSCSPDSSIKIPDALPPIAASSETENNADSQPITSESGSDSIDPSPVTSDANPPIVTPVVSNPTSPIPSPVPDPMPPTAEPVVTPPVVIPPVVTSPTPPPGQAIANGFYSIQGVSSGRCMDVSNGQTWDGLQMQIWECMENEPNQTFKLEWVEGRFYRITTAKNKALEGREDGLINGSPFQLGTYSGGAHQLFAIESTGNPGKYYLKSKLNNLVVDLAGDSRSNGSYLQFANQLTAAYQQWTLIKK